MDSPSFKERLRERLKKEVRHAKIALIALLGLEGALALYSIPSSFEGENKFIQHNVSAYQYVMGSVKLAYHELPLAIKFNFDLEQRAPEVIFEAASHPESVKSIDELMRMDDLDPYSEVQGLVTLDYENGNAMLRYYVIPTSNGIFARELIQHRNNPEIIKELIENNMEMYLTVTELEEEDVHRMIERDMIPALRQAFLGNSDNYAIQNSPELVDFYYHHSGEIEGEIVGKFHTHNHGSVPSNTDLDGSNHERSFVLVRHRGTYQIYDIVNEEERSVHIRRRK